MLAPLGAAAAVVAKFLLEELSVPVSVAVERLVALHEGLNFILRQAVLFI